MKKKIQFGRWAEVEIRSFEGNTKTVIGNEFEIEFEYFKTIDQTKQDDTGVIRVFGLTPKTIKALQDDGGEVWFRCGYTESEISTLFIASISRLYAQKIDNTTMMTIECSANLMSHYYTGYVSPNLNSRLTLISLLEATSKLLGGNDFEVGYNRHGLTESDKDYIEAYIVRHLTEPVFVGSASEIVGHISETYGFAIRKDSAYDGSVVVNFSLGDVTLQKILASSDTGFEGIEYTLADEKRFGEFSFTLEADGESGFAVVLDRDTGLIEAKTEYKISTAYADQDLNSNEEETVESQQKRMTADAKEAEKARKAAEKPNNPKKDKARESKLAKKRKTIKVNRRYNKVKSLLNPMVRPQSLVLVYDELSDDNAYGVYRVRSATFKGNNKRNDWIMELYCEDSEPTVATDEQIAQLDRSASLSEDYGEDAEDVIASVTDDF